MFVEIRKGNKPVKFVCSNTQRFSYRLLYRNNL